jgi:hypothetical protein
MGLDELVGVWSTGIGSLFSETISLQEKGNVDILNFPPRGNPKPFSPPPSTQE